MASVPTDPSVGLNAETGGTITGWGHVLQSLQDIFTTNFGARIMREHYGSFVPILLGRATINRTEAPLFLSAVATAILQWEPRYHITAIRVDEVSRDGTIGIVIEGEFSPRATYGDLTAAGGKRRLIVSPSAAVQDWTVIEG